MKGINWGLSENEDPIEEFFFGIRWELMYNLRALPPRKTQIANDESHGICTYAMPTKTRLAYTSNISHKFLSWPFNVPGLLAKEKTSKIT
jgi:hypothetical protein